MNQTQAWIPSHVPTLNKAEIEFLKKEDNKYIEK